MIHRLLCGAWVTVAAIAPLAAQSHEPVGRTLRDPGHTRELPISARAARPRTTVFLTTSGVFASATAVTTQVKATDDRLIPFASTIGHLSYSWIDHDPGHDNRLKVGLELKRALSRTWSFAAGYEWANTISVKTSGELFAEAYLKLFAATTTLGGIGYYDHSKPKGRMTRDGITLGVTGSWTAPTGLKISSEYDFKSDFNGEDSFSAKLEQPLGTHHHHTTGLIAGAGKHRLYTIALRIGLN